jgi:hypothetical protein
MHIYIIYSLLNNTVSNSDIQRKEREREREFISKQRICSYRIIYVKKGMSQQFRHIQIFTE